MLILNVTLWSFMRSSFILIWGLFWIRGDPRGPIPRLAFAFSSSCRSHFLPISGHCTVTPSSPFSANVFQCWHPFSFGPLVDFFSFGPLVDLAQLWTFHSQQWICNCLATYFTDIWLLKLQEKSSRWSLRWSQSSTQNLVRSEARTTNYFSTHQT